MATTGRQEEAERESHPQTSEGEQPCQHVDFQRLESRILGEYISVVSSCSVCGTLSWHPRKLMQHLRKQTKETYQLLQSSQQIHLAGKFAFTKTSV